MALPDATANKNLQGRGARATIQRFGGFLAGMIMPNIGAFIAWGLITALFIPSGWLPNATLASLVDPMITYLLALLIGYTGGRNVYGQRGAVIGAIATMGVIVGSSIPMFLGAMIMGPLSAWVLKQVDRLYAGKVRSGFEMLVDNFSLGIVGAGFAILGRLAIGPVVRMLMNLMAHGVDFLIQAHLLPLVSIFVEPAKVLFLNNAVNHGILTPLGTEQAVAAGKSILFMVESNPGPGFGLLMAMWLFGPRSVRPTVPGAVIIHLIGGIHEIFFPYVLMKPKLIIAQIAGGMSGLAVGMLLHAGLVAPASPGSIIAWMVVTPRGGYVPVLADFLIASLVSFGVAALLLIVGKDANEQVPTDADPTAIPAPEPAPAAAEPTPAGAATGAGATAVAAEPAAAAATDATTATTTERPHVNGRDVRQIIIACDAGMGSSVMVASTMKKKLASEGVDVIHTPVDSIPDDARLVMCHEGLAARARGRVPQAVVVPFKVYMGDPAFATVENAIKNGEDID